MMGPTHTLVGASTAFVATSALGLDLGYVALATGAAGIASTMPDADQRAPLKHLVRHREQTHYPALQLAFFAALVAAVYAIAPEWTVWAVVIAAPMALGCVMHSVADSMTVARGGIKLLWPLSRRGYHLLPWSMRIWVGTKSRSEWAFVAIWCLFVLIYAYARFGTHISS